MSDGLLLLHAFPLDARMWEPQVSKLGSELPVVAPDLPGFGGSPPAADVTTMAAASARVLEAVGQAGLDRALVCGLSMGGYVAFELWRRSPGLVLGLVLANTRSEADPEEGAARRRALAERLRAEGSAFLVEDPPPLLSPNASPELRARVRDLIADQPAEAIAAASLGMATRPDSSGDLPRIDVPTLLITGSEDRLIPPEVTSAMARVIPGAGLEVIEGVGHLSNLEAPDRFTDLLREQAARCGLG
ncbi:MAG TPA: alpha/beta fold hydrolase [Actinomycetota bacterium]|nr:alpha/beta fold hydrolase [Actinomycetota bacterium]